MRKTSALAVSPACSSTSTKGRPWAGVATTVSRST
jgi:hypothetical protein